MVELLLISHMFLSSLVVRVVLLLLKVIYSFLSYYKLGMYVKESC